MNINWVRYSDGMVITLAIENVVDYAAVCDAWNIIGGANGATTRLAVGDAVWDAVDNAVRRATYSETQEMGIVEIHEYQASE